MKHTLKYIILGALCAGLALAQNTPPSAASMAQRQVQRLTQQLSLTSSQQTQATTIFTTEYTANQAVMASLQQARTSLAAAIKANNSGDIGTISSQIGTLEGQMTANQATASAQLYAILTADQQAKYHVGGGGFGGFAGRGNFRHGGV